MNYYFESVNLNHWNLFSSVTVGGIETFVGMANMHVGDQVVFYVGSQKKGIVSGVYAIGTIISEPYIYTEDPKAHCFNRNSVDICFDRVSKSDPIIRKEQCLQIFKQLQSVHKIADSEKESLISFINATDSLIPQELVDPDKSMTEGSKERITVNKYERNPEARRKCIEKYGAVCSICGFDFSKMYGPEFAGKIEVHHIKPLNEIDGSYVVDPEKDLIPVCPNCHMILHSKPGGGVYSPEEVKSFIRSQKI
jgi:predicted HNH restriction endonuclease